MKPNKGNLRSASNSRKKIGKHLIFSPKLSRRFFEERARAAVTKERANSSHQQYPHGLDPTQRQNPQFNTLNIDAATESLLLNTPYKVDKTLLNFHSSYRNIQNQQPESELNYLAPTQLTQFLQIKSVNPINQRKSTPMDQQASKFSIVGHAQLGSSHIQLRMKNDPFASPSYVKNGDGNDDNPSFDARNETLPRFKVSTSALFFGKQTTLENERGDDLNPADDRHDKDIRTAKPEERMENGIKLVDFRSNPESPRHQLVLENAKYLEYDRGLMRRPVTQQFQQRKYRPEFEPINLMSPSHDQEKYYVNSRAVQNRATHSQKQYLIKNGKAQLVGGIPANLTNRESNNFNQSLANNGSIPGGVATNPQDQLLLQQTINSSEIDPSNIASEKPIHNLQVESGSGVLLRMKNNAQNQKNRAGSELTKSFTSLTTSASNPINITQLTTSTPLNSNYQSVTTITTKTSKRESLRTEDKEKRRLTYQLPINSNSNFKYYVGNGNNAELVKRVLSIRANWEATDSTNPQVNLKWQQGNRGYRYERLIANPNFKQLLNHFEFHRELTTKNGLIKSLSNYCEFNKINLFDFVPITFSFDMDDENFDSAMHRFTKFFIKYCGDPKKYASNESCSVKKSNPNILFTYEFKRKGKTLHILQKSVNDKQISPYLKARLKKTYYNGGNMWLLKPTGLNRGRGIELFNTLEDLNRYINQYLDGETSTKKRVTKGDEDGSGSDSESEEESKAKKGPPETRVRSHTFVIQKYIERPLLVYQRKFDIRVYAMVTHDMQLMFFKEGYLRTSSEVYSINENDIDNKFVHLTNDAVQKYSDKYGQAEQGNKLSYDEFQKYLDINGISLDVRGKVVPRMKELVQISMNSVKRMLNQNDRKYCFEIFGYDFFIDEELNIWLIEVNTNPCLEESCPLLSAIIPRMLNDAFKLTVDVLFPPKVQAKDKKGAELVESSANAEKEEMSGINGLNDKSKSFPLFNYDDNENLWEFLGSMEYTRPSIKKNTTNGGSQKPVMRI